MKTQTKSQIIDFITKNKKASPNELQDFLGISHQALHRHLKQLVERSDLQKVGKAPHVFYVLAAPNTLAPQNLGKIDSQNAEFLEDKYMYVNPQGQILRGFEGFQQWAVSTKQDFRLNELAAQYVAVRTKWDGFFNAKLGLIEASEKFNSTFERSVLTRVYYADFYSLPKFGKTNLGQLVLHGKQAQDKKLIREVADQCLPALKKMIALEKIDAVAWAPHSLPRAIQFLREFRSRVDLHLPEVAITKAYSGDIPIAQKTLTKLEERIENAEKTIFLTGSKLLAKRVLVIDDAVGSGATLQAIAEKIKHMNAKSTVIGYAVVGSLKGFDVIKEV